MITTQTENMKIAEQWLIWGAAVIPIADHDKKPIIDWKPYQQQLPSAEEVQRWFDTHAPRNIAIVTGHNGLTVIDFDDQAIYDNWLRYGDKNYQAKLVQKFTYQVATSRGRHVYVRLPEATKSRALIKSDKTRWGIDIKSRGGFVLCPPSIHPSGAVYRALNEGAPVVFVEALSDILPAELLMNVDVIPSKLQQRPKQPLLDPWDAAMRPAVLGPGTVNRIKTAYRLEDILPVVTETGSNFYLTRCPLHDDHNPSMWVKADDQICGCYAGCTVKPLDFINLYARIHDLSNLEAIRELARGI